MQRTWIAILTLGMGVGLLVPLFGADEDPPGKGSKRDQKKGEFQQKGPPGQPGGPGGDGFGKGPGGPGRGGPMGGPMGQEMELVKKFDTDSDGRLNREERDKAREYVKKERPAGGRGGFGRGPGGPGGPGGPPPGGPGKGGPPPGGPGAGGPPPGGPGGPGGPPPGGPGPGGPGGGRFPGGPGGRDVPEPKPGAKISPADVTNAPASLPLYDGAVLRTLFLDFEDKDWEAEMADFNNTDVEVPATLTVDGKKYPGVGVHFRGMSSFMGVRAGSKRSINIAVDFVDPKQRLLGYKTLNLLNAHEDPSFLGTVLYSHIARKHIPAPKANLVRLVINGENWGVYPSVQQFNNDFLKENYETKKGARWKVRGSPGGQGGLEYLGDNVEEYKRRYDMKSGTDKDWQALIEFCKTLNKTPPARLEEALAPICDLDGALWFLALDNGLINCDGYWIRSSDYSIYLDEKGKFHFLPHDMNEAFRAPMGPGMRGGQAGSGSPVELHPLVGIEDKQKPLRSKLLAVPSLKARYLEHIAKVGEELDWKNLGPVVAQYRALIEKEIEADTKKLSTFAEFQKATADTVDRSDSERAGRRNHMSLRDFAEQRSRYLQKFKKGETAPELPKELAAGPGGPGGFGPGGPAGPGGFGPGTFMAPMLLESADKNTDKKLSKEEILTVVNAFAAQADPDKTGSLDQAKLAAALAAIVPGPPGGGGEGPSMMFAGAIFEKADANKDSKLVAAELAALVDSLFKEWDKDTSGALEEAELTSGMNAALPRPFGPPGFGPGGGPPGSAPGAPGKGPNPPG